MPKQIYRVCGQRIQHGIWWHALTGQITERPNGSKMKQNELWVRTTGTPGSRERLERRCASRSNANEALDNMSTFLWMFSIQMLQTTWEFSWKQKHKSQRWTCSSMSPGEDFALKANVPCVLEHKSKQCLCGLYCIYRFYHTNWNDALRQRSERLLT